MFWRHGVITEGVEVGQLGYRKQTINLYNTNQKYQIRVCPLK